MFQLFQCNWNNCPNCRIALCRNLWPNAFGNKNVFIGKFVNFRIVFYAHLPAGEFPIWRLSIFSTSLQKWPMPRLFLYSGPWFARFKRLWWMDNRQTRYKDCILGLLYLPQKSKDGDWVQAIAGWILAASNFVPNMVQKQYCPWTGIKLIGFSYTGILYMSCALFHDFFTKSMPKPPH